MNLPWCPLFLWAHFSGLHRCLHLLRGSCTLSLAFSHKSGSLSKQAASIKTEYLYLGFQPGSPNMHICAKLICEFSPQALLFGGTEELRHSKDGLRNPFCISVSFCPTGCPRVYAGTKRSPLVHSDTGFWKEGRACPALLMLIDTCLPTPPPPQNFLFGFFALSLPTCNNWLVSNQNC